MDSLTIENLQELANSHPYLLALALIWMMIWKGLGLWRAAERGEKGWFIAILIVNTLGLLEIIYLFFVAKPRTPKDSSEIVSS